MTLLYAAFAVVALWLLGELLLQRRAPLHWRALALLGFLALVAGVAQKTLPLIGVGVVAFGAGQALATRAVKHAAGADYWSLVAPESVPLLGRLFGGEGRPEREPEADFEPEPEPEPQSEPRFAPEPVAGAEAVEATAVFQADEYAVDGDSVHYTQNDYAYTQNDYAQAAYYTETDPYAQQQYQEQYQQQYQEYAQYAQYPEQQQYPQYTEQQQYASYEQQQYPQQTSYDQQQYAQYGTYTEQGEYYTPDPQYHAPQG